MGTVVVLPISWMDFTGLPRHFGEPDAICGFVQIYSVLIQYLVTLQSLCSGIRIPFAWHNVVCLKIVNIVGVVSIYSSGEVGTDK